MSMAALTSTEFTEPAVKWARTDKVHKQSWAQQVMAAADSLSMPKESMRNMVPGSLLGIQENRLVNGAQA